jgi:hypothetical protein
MSRQHAAWVATLLIAACGQKSSPPASDKARDATATATTSPSPAATGDAHARRAAWLDAVLAIVKDPATLPRLSDPAAAARLEALLSEPAWIDIDGATFARDGKQLIAFFPAIKSLSLRYGEQHAADEAVLTSLYMDQVSNAFINGGLAWMASLNEPPDKRRNREQGLATVQLGKAMNVCGMLAMLGQASAPVALRALAHLSAPASYAGDSAESLQLVLATLDAQTVPPAIREPVTEVREVIAAEHARRVAAASAPPAARYEALPIWSTFEPREVVSRHGGFAITVGPGALVWSTEPPAPSSQLQWRDGDFVVEVHCVPGVSEKEMSDRFRASTGAVRRADARPGLWLATRSATDQGMLRILAVGDRTCVVGAQAPLAQYDEKRADRIVGSFRPAP